MSRTRRGGFLLVMVAGFLTLLALTAVALLGLARLQGASSGLAKAAAQARLAADSGLAYAAGRLWESTDRFPGAPRLGDAAFDLNASRRPAVANRGDDWHYRAYDRDDGSWFADQQGPVPLDWLDPPLPSTDHPSYAHGESWKDADGDGLFDAGAEPWDDADGNGRRDVYSGRLRGPGGSGPRFRLRIEVGPEAKLPVNSRPDPDDPHHAALLDWVNRLGAVLGVADIVAVPASGGVPLLWSDVGDRLFAAYPEGGWRRIEELKGVLGENAYRALRRFLTTASPLSPEYHLGLVTRKEEDGTGPGGGDANETLRMGLLNLNAAPMRLLEASLRFRRTFGADRIAHALYDAADATDPHTGLSYIVFPHVVILHPPEAFRAAAGLATRVRVTGGFRSRHELFRYIDWRKQTWFPNEIPHKAFGMAMTYPAEGYQNVKADATFASFFDQRPREAPAALTTLDVDRFVRTADGHYPGSMRQREAVPLVPRPFSLQKPADPYEGGQPFDGGGPAVSDTFSWSLGAASAFDIASGVFSEGSLAFEAEGSCRVGECVLLETQEDFQNLGGRPAPWGPPDANPAETRRTIRGLQVKGGPSLSTSGAPASLDVVTLQSYPRDTFDPGDFLPSPTRGGVTLAHAPQDYLAPTGGGAQASFGYLAGGTAFPDAADIEAQQAWAGAGFGVYPVWRNGSDSGTETYRDANLQWMRDVFVTSGPFGTTLSGNNRYSFYQEGSNNPNGLPPLPAGSVQVPAMFMDDPWDQVTVSTGDFRAITNLVFHFTYTGPLTGGYGTPSAPGEVKVFELATSRNPVTPAQTGAGTQMRLFKRADGSWTLDFLNGSLVTIDPLNPNSKWMWYVNSWGSWLAEPDVVEGHRQAFTGFFKPPPVPGGDPEGTVPRDPSWEESGAVHRISVFYFAQDLDDGPPQYPPSLVRCGVLIDGQTVVDHVWTRRLNAPCLPFRPAGYDPRAAPYPSAEMFYRLGPEDPLNGAPLTGDGRRILDVTFNRCTDVIFATAPGGDNPDAGSAFGAVQAAHDAYRALPRDFFRRKGTFSSARYVLPEGMSLREAAWGGVIPQSIWENVGSPQDALKLSLNAWSENDSPVGTASLIARRMPADEAGRETFYLPLGTSANPWGRAKVRSFSFDASFDVSDWSLNGQPLADAPALEEIWLSFRTPIRWLDGAGRAVPGAASGEQ